MRIKIFILFILISFGALSQNSIFWLNKPYRNQNNVQWVGTSYTTSSYGHIGYSYNGINFTDGSEFNASYGNVDWSGERWITTKNGNLIYSFNGINWVSYGFSGSYGYVLWDTHNDTWVISKSLNGISYTMKSTDGVNWTSEQNNFGFGKIVSAGTRYIGVSGSTVYYSRNAVNWSSNNLASSYLNAQLYDILWDGSRFIITGTYTNEDITKTTIWQSTDGVNYSILFRDDYDEHEIYFRINHFKKTGSYYLTNAYGAVKATTNFIGFGNLISNSNWTISSSNQSLDTFLTMAYFISSLTYYYALPYTPPSYLNQYSTSFAYNNLKHRSIIKYNPLVSSCPQTTVSIYNFSVNYMDMISTINSDGGLNIISRGICWSKNQNPTISDNVAYGVTNNTSEIIRIQPLSGGTVYYARSFVQNEQCITYSNQQGFQTYAALPATVVTTEPTSISAVSAVSGGNVTQDGGGFIQQRGVCWSTSSNPVYTGNHTEDGTGTGVFMSNISGLSPNTLYYVRAYAVNPAGVVYGSQYSFTTTSTPTAPLVTTLGPSEITNQSAHLYGRVDSDGGANVSEYGFTYGTYPNPDLSGGSVAISSGVGSFDIILSGIPSATTFHYRAYAINSAGTSYGVDKSFTTLSGGLATVETYGAYNIDETSAYISGTIVDTGSATITTTGFIIGLATNPDPTLSSNLFFTQHDGVVAYDQFTGLTSGTTYKARMYAINEAGTAYGNVISFQTTSSGVPPSVSTTAISDITVNSASSGGNVTFNGGSTITSRGVCWNTTGNPTIADNKTSDGSGDGSFTSSITGLTCGTTYYVRGYATNQYGTGYGDQFSFVPNNYPLIIANLSGYAANQSGCISIGGYWTVTLSSPATSNLIIPITITNGTNNGDVNYNIPISYGNTTGSISVNYYLQSSPWIASGSIQSVPCGYSIGTSANINIPVCSPTLNIGDSYGGGIIAYIYQPSDAGYISGEVHGIIAAASDIAGNLPWATSPFLITNATSFELSDGDNNTTIIVAVNGTTTTYAARICDELSLNGYSDWCLPSMNELLKLSYNKLIIGGFSSLFYWSSTELDRYTAYGVNFSGIGSNNSSKGGSARVRAIRYF